MRSLARLALGIALFVVVAPSLLYAWFALLEAVGKATNSGIGSCSPYGPFGGALLLGLFAGFPAAAVGAFLLARRIVNRVLPAQLVFQNLMPGGGSAS